MSETITTPPFQTEQPKRKVSFLLGLGIFLIPIIFSWFTLKVGYSTISRIVSFVWLALTLAIVFIPPSTDSTVTSSMTSNEVVAASNDIESQSENQTSVSQSEESTPVEETLQTIQISAKTLFQEYEANEVAADRNYKNQTLEVSGYVNKIDSGIGDGANVHFNVGDEFGINSVVASGDSGFDDYAASLSKGQYISLRCEGGGEVIGQPFLNSCSPI